MFYLFIFKSSAMNSFLVDLKLRFKYKNIYDSYKYTYSIV